MYTVMCMYLENCAIGKVCSHLKYTYLKWLHTFPIAQFPRDMLKINAAKSFMINTI